MTTIYEHVFFRRELATPNDGGVSMWVGLPLDRGTLLCVLTFILFFKNNEG